MEGANISYINMYGMVRSFMEEGLVSTIGKVVFGGGVVMVGRFEFHFYWVLVRS